MDIRSIATTKIGPLPAWAWGGIAGGAGLVWRVWRNRGNADPGDGAGDPVDVTLDESGGALGVARPDLLGGRDTAGWPPASGAPYPDASVPDWLAVPPSWYTDPPPPIVVEAPGSTLVDQPSPVVAPPAPTPSSSTPAPSGTRNVGPWATAAMRDRAVADAQVVRKYSSGGKFYATIRVAPAAAPAAPAAPAPTGRRCGWWATAAMRDRAVANLQVVRKYSSGGKFYATIRG